MRRRRVAVALPVGDAADARQRPLARPVTTFAGSQQTLEDCAPFGKVRTQLPEPPYRAGRHQRFVQQPNAGRTIESGPQVVLVAFQSVQPCHLVRAGQLGLSLRRQGKEAARMGRCT